MRGKRVLPTQRLNTASDKQQVLEIYGLATVCLTVPHSDPR